MKLSELVAGAGVASLAGPAEAEIRGLRHDSRAVEPGDLFFALSGARTDGNRHVRDACQKGAVAIVSELAPPPPPLSLGASWVQVRDAAAAMGRISERFFGAPSRSMAVIGVTGTNGKTTTTYFLESIVSSCGGVPGVAGTINYRLAGRELLKAPNTTPISLELQRLLARFRDEKATHALMEVSSHALALQRADEVAFDAGVFTNLTRDHLDFHQTIEEYFRAKLRLFELVARSGKPRRVAAINADDPRAEQVRQAARGCEVVLFGRADASDLRAEDLELGLDGARFKIRRGGRRLSARIRLVGEHNVSNALGAAAAALGLGLPEEGVLAGLAELPCVPGRLEPVEEGQAFRVFIDYAHTDAALETVLSYLARLPHKRLITVFGCGGERDRSKRGPMGVAACRHSDLAVVTSDNPRREDPARILSDIRAGIETAGFKNYKIVADRREAIGEAVARAGEGDLVLIAGKGHEDYQILADRTVPFDDRQAARQAIRALLGRKAL